MLCKFSEYILVSKAVYIFCSPTGQHRKDEEFGKVSPCRQIPAIDDSGFFLFERYMNS